MNVTTSFKKVLHTKTTFVAFALCAFMFIAAKAADKANFSGTWTLNEQKSELGQFGGFTPKTLKLDQKEDGLSIERTVSFNGQERTASEKLTLDGKENESTVYGNSKKKSTAKWSEDGQTLTVNSVVNFERNGQSMEIKSAETWKLLNDGKTLSLETTATSPMGTNTVKAIYDKK